MQATKISTIRRGNRMDTRIIRRLIYDENYQRALQLLLNIIENQEERIQELERLSSINND